MEQLTSKQRSTLTKSAQNIKPVVLIGQNGVTDTLRKKVEESLAAHELIKIKFLDFKNSKNNLTEDLAEKSGASIVRIIGNIAILFRRSKEPEKRKYLK